MNALLLLIPVSLILVAVAVAIFFWAVRHDQFQDMDSPKILPLLDREEQELDESGPSGASFDD
ncbi:cbb3-type cytochrome oxidase assembly protein CcoS [Oleiagrimonas sp. MCCC 1A03011]|uniref:cbb3-type cytochrome oxidase assembly protein CcoS n=1 Tax=Oleiagrimonas sp. MCCC 1A03011 TaxID=1926883 RepID=UPI000DC20851|nr:cbb3-type cytochrome oxidase assembly protein CcoS [Oleiagrimonas sp. MCCC 1A03011]RAP55703.1 cytochrome oxidase maturation protein, cbb3-type [Oleiagrimonas sp. MCCC 1A03011]